MGHNTGSPLLESAMSLFGHIRGIRRELHQTPEPGFKEFKTAALISEQLSERGIPFRDKVAGTGIIARIEHDPALPTVALRADMDALPLQEKTGVPFQSRNEGFMHACGHDMHTACLLGVLVILNERKSELPVNVRGIFQPGEESVPGGAQFMIREGALENPTPAAILGLHVDPTLSAGAIAVKPGPMMAATAMFTITVKGRGGHAASPYKSVDPIPAAARIIEALQTIQSRMIDPFGPCVISVTKIEAGVTYNIVPETAVLCGTARTLDPRTMDTIPEKMEKLVKGITEGIDASYEFEYVRGTSVLVNDDDLTAHVAETGRNILGESSVKDFQGTFGGEDFADYLGHVPGCFFRLGCGLGDDPAPLHNPHFNPDENALTYGMAVMSGIVLNFGGLTR